MNTNELIALLDESANKLGYELAVGYTTIVRGRGLFLSVPNDLDKFNYINSIEDAEKFISSLKPASKLDALKKQRDELQKQIDELGGETLICNEGN